MFLIELPPQTPTFWQWNIGQIGSAVSIILALWGFHRKNAERIEQKAVLDTDNYNKVTAVSEWIEEHGPDLIESKTKVNLMYDIWFKSINDKYTMGTSKGD